MAKKQKRKPYYRFVIESHGGQGHAGAFYWWRLNRGGAVIAVSHRNFGTKVGARNEVKRLKANLAKAEIDEVLN